MAIPIEKVNQSDTFIITAGSLGLTEVEFFVKLINMFPSELDFNKIRSPSEYLSFRNNLASKFMAQSDVETLKKISISLLNGHTTENVAEAAIPQKTISKRQKKNKRSRLNKRSKLRAVAQLKKLSKEQFSKRRTAPWFDPASLEPPPKKIRIGDPFLPLTPARGWVQYMPIVKFSVYPWNVRELTTILARPLTSGSVATRLVKEEEYRHDMGCHTVDDGCHICDQVYRYHFFDDYFKVTSRIIAFVALHHWMDNGRQIPEFNWCPQTWYEEACVDGIHIPAADVGELIKRYIDSGKVQIHNQNRNIIPGTIVEKCIERKPPNARFSFRLTR